MNSICRYCDDIAVADVLQCALFWGVPMLRSGSSTLWYSFSSKLSQCQSLVAEFGKASGRRSEVFGIWWAGARTAAVPVSKSSPEYIEPGP